MSKKEYSEPFSHPRWNQIPAVKVIGQGNVTEEELKIVKEYKEKYFAQQEKMKK